MQVLVSKMYLESIGLSPKRGGEGRQDSTPIHARKGLAYEISKDPSKQDVGEKGKHPLSVCSSLYNRRQMVGTWEHAS